MGGLAWLALAAWLQVGYMPVQVALPGLTTEYIEFGATARVLDFLTVEGSTRTYIFSNYFLQTGNFYPMRDDYTVKVFADPTSWLQVGFVHRCSHAVAPFDVELWPGDYGSVEWYARVKIGSAP
jgi:hypothetical protein